MPRELPHPKYEGLDLEDLYRFTLVAAKWRLKAHPRLGTTPDDITNQAFLALHRLWNPTVCTAKQFLHQRVVHEIDALYRRPMTRRTDVGLPENILEFRDHGSETPEQLAARLDEERKLIAYIEDSHKGCAVLAHWVLNSNLKTSREFGEMMNLDPTKVDYLKRRLKMIIEKFVSDGGFSAENVPSVLKRIDGLK